MSSKIILSNMQSELDSWGGRACADNASRLIVHDERTIYLFLKQSRQVEYASYTPETYYFMASPHYCSYFYDYKAGRAKVELMPHYNVHKRYKHNIATVMLQWYKQGLSADEFVRVFPYIVQELKDSKQTADHINSDTHNHCAWNLDQITSTANSQKSDYAARIKPPYYCYSALTEAGIYRICFGYKKPLRFWGQELCIQCETPELFLDFLKKVMSMKKPAAWVRKYGTPAEIYKSEPKSVYASQDFAKADKYAEKLLSMEEDQFQNWTSDTKLVVSGF